MLLVALASTGDEKGRLISSPSTMFTVSTTTPTLPKGEYDGIKLSRPPMGSRYLQHRRLVAINDPQTRRGGVTPQDFSLSLVQV